MGGKKPMPIGAKVKITNKWINKMTKRGKLRKKDRAKIFPHQKQFLDKIKRQDEQLDSDLNTIRTKNEFEYESDDDLPFDMLDSDDELLQPKNKRRKLHETLSEYETVQPNKRSFGGEGDTVANLKHLLPIKTAAGRLVPLSIRNDEPEDGDVDDNEKEAADGIDEQVQVPLTAAQLFAKRAHLIEEAKKSIASMCRQLLESPEHYVGKLKDLVCLARGYVDPLVQFTVQKLATASLLEVFVDIIPSYKIRPWSEKEETQNMKKETKHLHQFEESLLRNYKKYLQHLESLCKYFQTRKLRQNGVLLPVKVAETFGNLSIKSYCSLLDRQPHFNFRTNILTVIVPLMSNKNENVRNTVCSTIENLFKSDKSGEISLDAVKIICDFIKNNPFKTHPRMLETFLSLKIKEVEKQQEGMSVKEKILARKRKMKMMSRKEKKFQKRMEKLDNELKDLEAEENANTVLKMHTAIMNKIFVAYFRILKNKSRDVLLAPVLEGLAKFAHLINVEFFDDLIKSLFNLVNSADLKPLESLHCTKTVFIILSGEGQSLNVDPYGFYKHVYNLLPKILKQHESEMFMRQFSLYLECLDAMINARRKQVTLPRVAAFVKRLTLLCNENLPVPIIVGTLSAIRTFFLAHPKLDALLDSDTVGGGRYAKDLDDPDRCNAFATDIIQELDHFKTHNDSLVRQLALHIRHGLPADGQHRLPPDVAELQPWLLFERMLQKSIENQSMTHQNRTILKRKRRK